MVSRLPGAAGRAPRASPVTNARSRLPPAMWKELFKWLSRKARKLSAGLGGQTLAMPLLKMLKIGDLIAGDRCFAGANLYCHRLGTVPGP